MHHSPARPRRAVRWAACIVGSLLGSGLLAAPALGASPTAYAPTSALEPVSRQVNYTCQVAGVPGESTIGLLVQFDAPASLSPGESVTLAGSVTLRFPERVRAAAQAADLTSVEGFSDTVTFPVTVGDQSAVLLAERVQVPRSSVGNPLVVSAQLALPTITVPADASGEIVVELPRNDTVDSPRPDLQPARVAFTAMATLYGDAGSQEIGLFCYHAADLDRVIARIPIGAAPTAGAATPGRPARATRRKRVRASHRRPRRRRRPPRAPPPGRHGPPTRTWPQRVTRRTMTTTSP